MAKLNMEPKSIDPSLDGYLKNWLGLIGIVPPTMAKSANIPFIYIGRKKIGVSQLNFKRELVEEAIDKLLSSGELI